MPKQKSIKQRLTDIKVYIHNEARRNNEDYSGFRKIAALCKSLPIDQVVETLELSASEHSCRVNKRIGIAIIYNELGLLDKGRQTIADTLSMCKLVSECSNLAKAAKYIEDHLGSNNPTCAKALKKALKIATVKNDKVFYKHIAKLAHSLGVESITVDAMKGLYKLAKTKEDYDYTFEAYNELLEYQIPIAGENYSLPPCYDDIGR